MGEPQGRIEVIAGCMFSGKTEELIRRLRRATLAKQKVLVFKPAIDNRYAPEKIASHAGVTFDAIPIDHPEEMLAQLQDADVIGLDEGQFFPPEIVETVQAVARGGKRVVIVGLDMDYQGVPFGSMPQLLAIAERIDKLTAVCMVCGTDATRSQRIAASDSQVLVGGDDVYEARCRQHWSPTPVFSRMEDPES